jgi:hypothetical protein
LLADIRVDWNLTNDNSQENALIMSGHINDQLITGDDDLNLFADLHYGMNAFFFKISASDLTADAFGSYDFSKHLSFALSVDNAGLFFNGTTIGRIGMMLASDRQLGSADGLNRTADMHTIVRVLRGEDLNETFKMESAGQYGLVWDSRCGWHFRGRFLFAYLLIIWAVCFVFACRFMEITSFSIALDEELLGSMTFSGHLADESMGMHLLMHDHNDTAVMHTHTALNWSDPAEYDMEVHLSLASATDFFGIADWDAEATVDYAARNSAFAVRVCDRTLAGDEVLRLFADGDYTKAEHTL